MVISRRIHDRTSGGNEEGKEVVCLWLRKGGREGGIKEGRKDEREENDEDMKV